MACEACWSRAWRLMMDGKFESQSDGYRALMELPMACTPEEQCGVGTTEMHTIHAGETQCKCGLKSGD